MKQFYLALLSLFLISEAVAQYDRVFEPLFETRPGYPKSGWIVGLGATYNLNNTDESEVLLKNTPDSLFYGSFKSSSMPGIYAELGRFTNIPNGVLFNQLDFGVNFKQLIHHQELDAYLLSPDDLSADTLFFEDPDAKYNDLNIGVHFNLSRIIQISDYNFIKPSIGVHGDFRIGGAQSFALREDVAAYSFPERQFKLALHVKVAWGVKLTRETFLIPSIELQLHDLSNSEGAQIGKTYFHSTYNPLIFSVRYMIHRPHKRNDCASFDNRVNLERKRRRKTGREMF